MAPLISVFFMCIITACCDGKHDVGSLSHRQSHTHASRPASRSSNRTPLTRRQSDSQSQNEDQYAYPKSPSLSLFSSTKSRRSYAPNTIRGVSGEHATGPEPMTTDMDATTPLSQTSSTFTAPKGNDRQSVGGVRRTATGNKRTPLNMALMDNGPSSGTAPARGAEEREGEGIVREDEGK